MKVASSLQPWGAGLGVAVAVAVGLGSAATMNTALTPLASTVYVPGARPLTLSGMVVSKGVIVCTQPRSAGLMAGTVIRKVLPPYCTWLSLSVAQDSVRLPRTTAFTCKGSLLAVLISMLCTCASRTVGGGVALGAAVGPASPTRLTTGMNGVQADSTRLSSTKNRRPCMTLFIFISFR